MPSHSSTRPRPARVVQVEPRAELAEAVAVGVVEVAVVGAGGQAGEVELDGEVQRPVLGQVFQQVGDLQRRAAGVERHALGDPHRHAAGGALADQLHLDAVGIAADAGFVDAVDEIAALRRLAGGHRLERRVVVVELVDQALARRGRRTAAAGRGLPA